MKAGCFYFIKDEFFYDFPNGNLMHNKKRDNNMDHNRPCFFSFEDTSTHLFWLIPISSKVNKYKIYYENKIKRYGLCDTIVFGKVLGKEKAFLIQNMFPISKKYIKSKYIDSKSRMEVRIDKRLEKEIIDKSKKVLALQRKGYAFIFVDALKIEKELLNNE